MTRDEVITNLCQTVALAYHSICEYGHASDGFCQRCPFHDSPASFRHDGVTLRYVRDAVVAKLKADGFTIAAGFNPVTGDEIEKATESKGNGNE